MNRPNLCGNCAFPQHFHTRKLGEITVFFRNELHSAAIRFLAWSREGCKTLSRKIAGTVRCECTHLTNFALLLDVYKSDTNGEATKQLQLLNQVGETLFSHCLVKIKRNEIQSDCKLD